MAKANEKPSMVEIWIYNGKEIPMKISSGKVCGNIVTFKEMDPLFPVVWMGQKSYRLVNPRNKKNILFYDSLSKALFKPGEMTSMTADIDMITQASQNVMMGGQAAKEAMGMNDTMSSLKMVAIAGMILIVLLVCVFAYMLWNAHPAAGGAATTTIIQNGTATTTILAHTIGPQIVPVGTT